GREAGEGVDVGVGIVALEVAVLEPEHAVLAQPAAQAAVQLLAAGLGMALVEAAPGGQQRALAIGLDGAAFKSKINCLQRTVDEDSSFMQALDQAVVLAGPELPAPAGEAEIEQLEAVPADKADRPGVAQPGVVV